MGELSEAEGSRRRGLELMLRLPGFSNASIQLIFANPLLSSFFTDESWPDRLAERTEARPSGEARAEVEALLDSAVAQFEAIGMTGWLRRAAKLRAGRPVIERVPDVRQPEDIRRPRSAASTFHRGNYGGGGGVGNGECPRFRAGVADGPTAG